MTADPVRRIFVLLGIPIGALALAQLLGVIGPGHELIHWAVLAQAMIFGLLNAIAAVGIVLVYRSSRIINFAHSAFGVGAANIFMFLTVVYHWSWWFAVPVAVAAAAVAGLIIEATLVRRFARSPRLVLTVVTLAVGQVLAGLIGLLPRALGFFSIFGGATQHDIENLDPLPGDVATAPFHNKTFEWFPIIFRGSHAIAVVVALAVLVAIAVFFRRSAYGIAIRGASENNDRAALLGINTSTLSSLVWVVAAAMSAIAAIMLLPLQGATLPTLATGIGAVSLLRALAAAVFGRLQDIPLTVSAAIGIAIFESSVFTVYSQTAIVDAALLLAIIVVLLFQRSKLARTEEIGGSWAASEEVRGIPAELANVTSVRRGKRWVLGALGVLLLGYPWVMSPSQTNLGGLYAIFGIVAVSLVVLTGWGGQISLGQFAFVAVGAVFGGTMTSRWGVPFLLALPLASLVGAGVAVLLGLPALRIKGLYLAVTTMAFAVAVRTVFLNDRFFGWLLPATVVPRPKLLFIDTEDERAYYYLCLVGLALAVAVAQGLRRTRTGRVLIAMRDNERGAQSFGLSLVKVRLATFAISGFLAAFAGVLYVHHQHGIIQDAFAPEQSLQMFLMAVIGGLGSVTGVLLGALYLGTAGIVIGGAAGQLLTSGVGVILVMLYFPGGLGSLAFGVRDSWLRRIAIRDRISVPSLLGDQRVADGDSIRVPLRPKKDGTGAVAGVPVHYELPSRIGVAGASQATAGWHG